MNRKRILLPLILIALFALTAIGSRAQTSTTDSAAVTRTTQPAPNGDVCAQRLDKALADLDAADSLIIALRDEIESRRQKQLVDAALIEEQQRLIALYEKRRGLKVSFLFGLITVRKN